MSGDPTGLGGAPPAVSLIFDVENILRVEYVPTI